MNWYKQQQIENFCKEAGLWGDLKGIGGGLVGVIKGLLKAGISAVEIAQALGKVFGNIAKMPGDAYDAIKDQMPSTVTGEMDMPDGTVDQIRGM